MKFVDAATAAAGQSVAPDVFFGNVIWSGKSFVYGTDPSVANTTINAAKIP